MNAPVIETPIRLSLTRSFEVPPERLFDAWLDESFGDWLGTEDVVCLSCEIDARVGGQWKTVHRIADGGMLEHGGVYKQISRPTTLAFTWSGGCAGPNITLVTIGFKAKGAGTEMTLTHEGFASPQDCNRHSGGWSASFDRLARYLAG
jgi:uncharacterized protein YndB with AHSA1/START domain